jgi:carboxy-terminal domain RNA polymerase II polypeptide A small phosphatase
MDGGTTIPPFYINKRPGVDDFLTEMAKYYEIVIFTASIQEYADKVLDQLDTNRVIRSRLYGPSCVRGGRTTPWPFAVKDLSLLGRDLSQTIIVDDNPRAYSFQPDNAINITSFPWGVEEKYASNHDLEQIAAFLKGIKDVPDVRGILKHWREWPNTSLERTK